MSTPRKVKAPTRQCTGLDHLKNINSEHLNTTIAYRLTGSRCQCAACGEIFNSVSVFDLHRVGPSRGYPSTRRCLTFGEMMVRGWSQNARSFWIRCKRQHLPRRIDDHGQPCISGAGMNGRARYAK